VMIFRLLGTPLCLSPALAAEGVRFDRAKACGRVPTSPFSPKRL
jgi:hypothetical protein